MPSTTTANHPSGKTITFTESDHSYIDDQGHHYTSGTSLLKKFFPAFDKDRWSKHVAQRDNRSVNDVLAEWDMAAGYGCSVGTRVHENCENQFAGHQLHQPKDEREKELFTLAWEAVNKLQSKWRLIGTEMIVFSPHYYVAGTIDLIMQNPASGDLWLLDWKNNKEISDTPFGGEKGLYPCDRLDNCDLVKYQLQLSVYHRIIIDEKYVPRHTRIHQALIHLRPDEGIVWIPLSYLRAETAEMILSNFTIFLEEVPF